MLTELSVFIIHLSGVFLSNPGLAANGYATLIGTTQVVLAGDSTVGFK
jgi:hypothetical protein